MRTSAPASACCRRCRHCGPRSSTDGSNGTHPRPADRTLPVTERLRRLAGRRRASPELRGRLHGYAEKASAKPARILRGTTPTPTSNPRFTLARRADRTDRSRPSSPLSSANSTPTHAATAWARSLLQLTAPGIPDVYQGTELWEDSLVDPDNRRPVDYRTHREALKALSHPKLRVVAAALRLRRDRPDTLHFRRLRTGVGGRARPATMSWPSCAVTTSWPRSAAGPCG